LWESDITVGAVYSFGSQTIQNNINIIPDSDGEITRSSEIKYSQIKVLLGFEI